MVSADRGGLGLGAVRTASDPGDRDQVVGVGGAPKMRKPRAKSARTSSWLGAACAVDGVDG
ncbi:hypothetical protein GCM10007967_34900 [Xylanimonas ulmi]